MIVKIGDCFVEPSEIAMVVDSYDSHVEVKPMICIYLRCGSSHWIHSTMDEAEAALIDAGLIENPYAEDDDAAPELSTEERVELEAFDAQGFAWLARDADGKVFAYKEKPALENGYFFSPGATQPVQAVGAFAFLDFCEFTAIPFLLNP
jgi:hypothetical protein